MEFVASIHAHPSHPKSKQEIITIFQYDAILSPIMIIPYSSANTFQPLGNLQWFLWSTVMLRQRSTSNYMNFHYCFCTPYDITLHVQLLHIIRYHFTCSAVAHHTISLYMFSFCTQYDITSRV